MWSRPFVALCAVLGFLLSAHAQGFRPPREMRPPRGIKPEMGPFAAEGTVQAVIPGRIRILTNSKQNWMVLVDPKATIHVTGTAEPDFLRAGMFIQFTAEVDKRGTAKEKLSRLTIFTPSRDRPLGIWPEGAGPVDRREAKNEGEAEDRFGSGVPREMADSRVPTSNVYTVAGRITRYSKGKLTVSAGRDAVRIELAEEPEIDVDFADYTVAKPGDKISVIRGSMFVGRLGFAQAYELRIELSAPLSLAKKKPLRPKTPVPKRPSRRPKKEDADRERFEVRQKRDR